MVLEKFFVSKDEFIIRPVHDFGFKILFGHSSDPDCVLLKSFLEAIFEKKYEIIEFKDRQITPIQVFGKEVRLDLRLMCNDEELKDMAFVRMKREMDQITRLDNAKKQGFLEGSIEGEVKGQKKTLEIYRCLKQGIDVCQIASLLKMNVQEVIELKNEFEIL